MTTHAEGDHAVSRTASDFIIEKLVDECRQGGDVLVCALTSRELKALFSAALEWGGHPEKVIKAHGSEEILWPSGGRMRFVLAGRPLLGHRAAVVYVHRWSAFSDECRADAAVAANHGELIRG